MQASVFNLLNAVDDQSWDHWRGGRSKVSQGGLQINGISLYVENMKIIEENFVKQ